MLIRLELNHFATFPKAEMDLGPGLNILSGMSGAGKSLLLKALEVITGGRFHSRLAAEGEGECRVRALFEPGATFIEKWAGELDLDEGQLLIERSLRKDGRSLLLINGRMQSVDLLRRIGPDLCRILSQDESMGLRQPEIQRQFLDQRGALQDDLRLCAQAYGIWDNCASEIRELEAESRRSREEEEFLRAQLRELKELAPQAGEVRELEEESLLLSRAEALRSLFQRLDDAGGKCSGELSTALDNLDRQAEGIQELEQLTREGRDIQITLEEWLRAVSMQSRGIAANPFRLAEVDERLRKIRSAEKRFGMAADDLAQRATELSQRLEKEPPEIRLEGLRKEEKIKFQELKKCADRLHKKRLAVRTDLVREIEEVLQGLEMGGGRFDIALERQDQFGPEGCTAVEFRLRPTPSHPYQPLHLCASGGERSRALLAICSSLSQALASSILVFDEIDTSIGSRLGRPIAKAIEQLAQHRQVICVTHLAPVAAAGQDHFLIEKGEQGSSVKALKTADRVREVAQMIAGEKDDKDALRQARSMLRQTGAEK